jgi:hypothetical protein
VTTELILEPVGREFALPEIEARLLQFAHSKQDETTSNMFLITDDAGRLERVVEARRNKPDEIPANVIAIRVWSHRILAVYWTTEVEPLRQFIEWLRARYEIRIKDYELNDLTSYCKDDLDFVLGPPT